MIDAMVVDMSDGQWAIPIIVIARNRATYYADEFGGDVEKSLAEDTLPLFEEHPYEIYDWAGNNMDWDDVEKYAVRIAMPKPVNRPKEWVEAHMQIFSVPEKVFDGTP